MNKIFYAILIFVAMMQEAAAQKMEENNFTLSEGVTPAPRSLLMKSCANVSDFAQFFDVLGNRK